MDKYVVSLTPDERNELKLLVAAGKAAARKLAHARILLLADGDDCLDEEIVSMSSFSSFIVVALCLEKARTRKQRFVVVQCHLPQLLAHSTSIGRPSEEVPAVLHLG